MADPSRSGRTRQEPVRAPDWTRTAALVREHAELRHAIGSPEPSGVPSIDACYRLTRKLRATATCSAR